MGAGSGLVGKATDRQRINGYMQSVIRLREHCTARPIRRREAGRAGRVFVVDSLLRFCAMSGICYYQNIG
ncbi:hypothetical protein TFLX_02456 [Thermoflexales bacterium]|nr:hypothetical protein TFLX_02456 [Thermoflexales bacterium]